MIRRKSAHSVSRRLSRRACALACAGLVALGTAAEARAATAVEVVLPEGTVALDAEQLAGAVDVVDVPYSLLEQEGAAPAVVRMSGVSIRAIVRLARANPDVVEGVTLTDAGGKSVTLHGPDLADPAPFADGPPLVALEGDAVTFLRPQRDPADVNGADRLSAAGAPLRVEVQSGAPIDVTAGADRERVAARGKVSFFASALGADASQRLTFRWDFGDGSSGRGESVVHRYRRAGRYRVVVTVAASGGGGGSSSPITIEVGEPPAEPDDEDEDEEDAPAAASGAYEGAERGTSGGDGAAARRTGGAKARREGRKPRKRPARDKVAADSGLEQVVGNVLGAPAPTVSDPAPAAAARPVADADTATGEPLGVELLGLAAIGLVGLGALIETSGRRRRLKHP